MIYKKNVSRRNDGHQLTSARKIPLSWKAIPTIGDFFSKSFHINCRCVQWARCFSTKLAIVMKYLARRKYTHLKVEFNAKRHTAHKLFQINTSNVEISHNNEITAGQKKWPERKRKNKTRNFEKEICVEYKSNWNFRDWTNLSTEELRKKAFDVSHLHERAADIEFIFQNVTLRTFACNVIFIIVMSLVFRFLLFSGLVRNINQITRTIDAYWGQMFDFNKNVPFFVHVPVVAHFAIFLFVFVFFSRYLFDNLMLFLHTVSFFVLITYWSEHDSDIFGLWHYSSIARSPATIKYSIDSFGSDSIIFDISHFHR